MSKPFLILIGWQAAMLAALALAAYAWALERYGSGSHARTVALLSLIGVQLGHLFNCRSRTRSAFDGLFRNPFVWAAAAIVIALQLLAVYLAPLALVLGTFRLTAIDWAIVGLCTLAPIPIVEAMKILFRRRKANAA